MKNNIKIIFFSFILSMQVLAMSFAFLPTTVFAQGAGGTSEQRCEKFKNQFTINPDNLEANRRNDPNLVAPITGDVPKYCTAFQILYAVFNILLILAGSIATLFILIGGFQYLTAAGNDEQAESAKKTLTNALIGLVVILLAATMVRILVNTLTGQGFNGSGATTQNPPAGNGSGNGQSTGGNPAVRDFTVGMSPETVTPASRVTFTISANEAMLANQCGTAARTFAAEVQMASGAVATSTMFTLTGSSYYATAEFRPGLISQSGTAVFYVCQKQIPQTIQVNVASGFSNVGGNSSGSDYSACLNETGDVNGCCAQYPAEPACGTAQPQNVTQAQITAAAGRASFSSNWLSANSLSVRLQVSSTDAATICANTPEAGKQIDWVLNGNVASTDQVTVRLKTFTIEGQVPASLTVGVRICGTEISGTQPQR